MIERSSSRAFRWQRRVVRLGKYVLIVVVVGYLVAALCIRILLIEFGARFGEQASEKARQVGGVADHLRRNMDHSPSPEGTFAKPLAPREVFVAPHPSTKAAIRTLALVKRAFL